MAFFSDLAVGPCCLTSGLNPRSLCTKNSWSAGSSEIVCCARPFGVRHRALAAVKALEAVLANVVVLATATPVPVPDEGRRTAPVAGDALVFPEMRGALFLCACGVTSDVGRKDGSVLTCSRARVISVRPETRALLPEGAQARPSHRSRRRPHLLSLLLIPHRGHLGLDFRALRCLRGVVHDRRACGSRRGRRRARLAVKTVRANAS